MCSKAYVEDMKLISTWSFEKCKQKKGLETDTKYETKSEI